MALTVDARAILGMKQTAAENEYTIERIQNNRVYIKLRLGVTTRSPLLPLLRNYNSINRYASAYVDE